MRFPHKEEVESLRKKYPVGCQVRLLFMDDPQAPPTGTVGKVLMVDDAGTVHVAWSTGSTLGIVPGQDSCERL